MKKFLLSMVAVLGALTASADVTVDFSAAKTTPTAESDTPTEAVVDGVNFSFVNCKKGTYQQASYLQVSGKNHEGKAYMDITLPEATKSIVLTTGANASTNVQVQLSANGTELGDAVKLSEKGAEFTLSIPEANQAKGTVVRLAVVNKYNAQITKMVFSAEGGTVTPDPEPTPDVVTKSVKETIALASGTQFTTDYSLTVGYVRFNNVFVCDEAGDFIQIYQKDNGLKVGDVIPAGLKGTYTLYNGVTPEIEKVTELPTPAAGTFEPKSVAAEDVTVDLVNSVVRIDNVVLDAATPAAKENFTGKVGDVELSFRNNYELESVEAGTYDITVVVTIFQDAPSLYVVEYKKSTGIADITVDENAAVEYFNLQGIRVAQPEQGGIYIRRQGNSVSKVLVK